MTQEMIEKAQDNGLKYDYSNVKFRLGDIEALPVENKSVNLIISNSVLNLAPDKEKVFREDFHVPKPGRMYISYIDLLAELPEYLKNDKDLLAGCVAGVILKEEYLKRRVSWVWQRFVLFWATRFFSAICSKKLTH